MPETFFLTDVGGNFSRKFTYQNASFAEQSKKKNSVSSVFLEQGVVPCICHLSTLEAEYGNGLG